MGKEATKKADSKLGKRFYPAEDTPYPLRSKHAAPKSAKLRSSIKPGQVLILLAGRYRGKRVVFLKQLASGLLLVTGPFKVNGVPLRRVNQAYVIGTSTQVDISAVKLNEDVNDAFFARKALSSSQHKKSEDAFVAGAHKLVASGKPDDVRIKEQACIDDAVLTAIKKVATMDKYLRARFGLTDGQKPHAMKF